MSTPFPFAATAAATSSPASLLPSLRQFLDALPSFTAAELNAVSARIAELQSTRGPERALVALLDDPHIESMKDLRGRTLTFVRPSGPRAWIAAVNNEGAFSHKKLPTKVATGAFEFKT